MNFDKYIELYKEFYPKLSLGSDINSILAQYTAGLLYTIFLVYMVVLLTKKFTYIRSHLWLMFDILVASILVFINYRIMLLLIDIKLLLWAYILLILPIRVGMDAIFNRIDGGRSLIDINAEQKSAFQTDYRLVPRATMFTMMYMWTCLVALVQGTPVK